MIKKVLVFFGVLGACVFQAEAQLPKTQWVDSVFNSLSTEQKIGQLFMVPVYVKSDKKYLDKVEDDVKNQHVGGLIFMDGGPHEIANLLNHLQPLTDVPLLTGFDGSRGLGKIVDSTQLFPTALSLGAIQNDSLIYDLGAEVARQMKQLGLHINFAPSADRTSFESYDSLERSFGDNKQNIARKAVAYMRGLQDNGVLACAKNFPIQGLTIVSIKKDGLPELNAYLDSVEIYPYKKLFDNNIRGVLASSAEFPIFFERKKIMRKNKFSPALLTSIYAGDWLKNKMNYQGLVFVSIPEIQSKTGEYSGGEAEVLAFQAGNDIILFPEDINPAIRKIRRLVRKEERYEALLNSRVIRILEAKYDAGLAEAIPVQTEYLIDRLVTHEGTILNQRLLEGMVTLARNDRQALPIKILEGRRFATLTIGEGTPNSFTRLTEKYTHVDHFYMNPRENETDVMGELEKFDVILAALFGDPSQYTAVLDKLSSLQSDRQVIVCLFNAPLYLKNLENFSTVLQAYNADDEMVKIVAQQVFGALPVNGALPLTISQSFRSGQGQSLKSIKRLGYSFPEAVGIDSRVLEKIETIAHEAIEIKATPGCHVLIARDGKVIYEKSFGHLTYQHTIPVTRETIFDLASVTKVSATLQTVMFMHDRGLIDLNRKASYYLPELKNSNKRDYTLKDILTHQAGLWPFLPFWAQTKKDTLLLPEFYSRVMNDKYPFVVAEGLYASRSMKDSLWTWIIKAKVRDKISRTPYDYRYSDMGFYILQHLAEKIINQPMEVFLEQNLYEPLGATTMGYLPLNRFPKERIAPTENDTTFRRRQLIGTVHDQGAAMHGGIAGHAGLFGTAGDLAKLGQMLLQGGAYGGIQYYKPETVRYFTEKQYESSRRGLGWDKPVQSDWNSPTSIYASPKTFGHTGFTGTCIWVDPEFNLVYVFLSNRVYPDMTNNKLLTANIRSRIQDVIYQSIFSYCQYN